MKDQRNKLINHTTRRYKRRALDKIEAIVIHHSGSDNDTLKSMSNYHVNHHNWARLSYHFVIIGDTIHIINDLDKLTYHTGGYNTKSIGICVMGNYKNKLPDQRTLIELDYLVSTLKEFMPNLEVYGHRDKKNTECPGDELYDYILREYK